MPDTPVIRLEVRFGDEPGWHNVQSSNDQTYSYRYTGGNGGAGDIVATVGQGPVTGAIRLIADRRYEISGCEFTNDLEQQLRFVGSGNAGRVIDLNSGVLSAKYTILVTDNGNENCTIPCDPMITNRPPASA